jgi:hypothetical protein
MDTSDNWYVRDLVWLSAHRLQLFESRMNLSPAIVKDERGVRYLPLTQADHCKARRFGDGPLARTDVDDSTDETFADVVYTAQDLGLMEDEPEILTGSDYEV